MTTRESLQREKYVVIHGQTWRFCAVKYVILLVLGWGIHAWGGWRAVGITFAILFVFAIALHLLFRWKTKAWTQDWGPYKRLKGLK